VRNGAFFLPFFTARFCPVPGRDGSRAENKKKLINSVPEINLFPLK
jgi:hypothetical protein